MDEEEEEVFRGWSQQRVAGELRPRLGCPYRRGPSVPSHRRAGRPPRVLLLSLVPGMEGTAGGGDNTSEWLEFSTPLCFDHMYWAAASDIVSRFQKWYPLGWEENGSVEMFTFQLPMNSGCSGWKDSRPRGEQGSQGLATLSPQSEDHGSLPKVISPPSLSIRSSQPHLGNPVKALVLSCSFTVRFL